MKTGLRHADYQHGMAVQGDGLVQDRGVAGAVAGPVAVAQHDHRIRLRRAIVLRRQHAPDGRPHAQHLEEIAGDHFGPCLRGRTLPRQGNAGAHARDHAAECRVLVAQIAIQGIGEDRFAVVAGAASGSVVLGMEHHQALRIFHRQRPQRDLVEQRKNGGIGPDPEGQREHRYRAEQRTAPQCAPRKCQVFPHAL